jgi:hypothetical protein
MSRSSHGPPANELGIYRIINTQAGHEFAKTEQFLVPVGSISLQRAFIRTRRFGTHHPANANLQDVFNSLEEITENTVNDTNIVRLAEHKNEV